MNIVIVNRRDYYDWCVNCDCFYQPPYDYDRYDSVDRSILSHPYLELLGVDCGVVVPCNTKHKCYFAISLVEAKMEVDYIEALEELQADYDYAAEDKSDQIEDKYDQIEDAVINDRWPSKSNRLYRA